MIFQALDSKKECYGIYADGRLYYKNIPENLSQTWAYSPHISASGVEFANLYCEGRSLHEMCPEHLLDRWCDISDKLKAFVRSFQEAKISLDDNCFFDLVPEKFLLEFFEIKNKISEHVFQTHSKPPNYDFLVSLVDMVEKIKFQKLNVDRDMLKGRMSEHKARQFYKKLGKMSPNIAYNLFGTKTGRLTTEKNSFPILTIDKSYRRVIKPTNDWLVEFDYNAAELRTLLALSNKKQPEEDLHEWNAKNIYRGLQTREEAKKRIFAWLYNPESKDYLSSGAYDRGMVVKEHYNEGQVRTFFGRTIPADDHHALNYILQSTTSDLVLRQAIKLDGMLRGKKTRIAFIVHDSIVLDYSEEDEFMLNDLYHAFAENDLDTFSTNARAGKNYGDLKRLWIQL